MMSLLMIASLYVAAFLLAKRLGGDTGATMVLVTVGVILGIGLGWWMR